MDNFRKY